MSRGVEWSAVEDSILQGYPAFGVEGLRGFLPGRSDTAIKQRACRLKVTEPAKRDEALCPVQAHEYTVEDRAWMTTRLPVYGPLRVTL